ncbi:hypothetical protein D3C87_1617690 [compost metagenome]
MQLLALHLLGIAQRQNQRLDLARHVVESGRHGTRFERSGLLHARIQAALAECIGGLGQAAQHARIGAQQHGQ